MDHLVYGDMYSQDAYVRRRFLETRGLLVPYIKDGVSILDIGCYTADLLHVIGERVEYVGVDSDQEALKIAQKRGAGSSPWTWKRNPYPSIRNSILSLRRRYSST